MQDIFQIIFRREIPGTRPGHPVAQSGFKIIWRKSGSLGVWRKTPGRPVRALAPVGRPPKVAY